MGGDAALFDRRTTRCHPPHFSTALYNAKAWADQTNEPVQWGHDEEEQKMTDWRLVETYIRESKIPADLRPDAVEVPVEADLREHGLTSMIGVLDLEHGGVIVDYKTSGQAIIQPKEGGYVVQPRLAEADDRRYCFLKRNVASHPSAHTFAN